MPTQPDPLVEVREPAHVDVDDERVRVQTRVGGQMEDVEVSDVVEVREGKPDEVVERGVAGPKGDPGQDAGGNEYVVGTPWLEPQEGPLAVGRVNDAEDPLYADDDNAVQSYDVRGRTLVRGLPYERGDWGARAGTSGATDDNALGPIPAGARVIGIAASASAGGATVTIPGVDGDVVVPIPWQSGLIGEVDIAPRANIVGPVNIVFTGTLTYLVEFVVPG